MKSYLKAPKELRNGFKDKERLDWLFEEDNMLDTYWNNDTKIKSARSFKAARSYIDSAMKG